MRFPPLEPASTCNDLTPSNSHISASWGVSAHRQADYRSANCTEDKIPLAPQVVRDPIIANISALVSGQHSRSAPNLKHLRRMSRVNCAGLFQTILTQNCSYKCNGIICQKSRINDFLYYKTGHYI